MGVQYHKESIGCDMSGDYEFLENSLGTQFETVKLLKNTPRGSVLQLRHIRSGKFFLLRRFHGSGEVYRKLLHIRCVNLPQIMEIAEKDENVLVLEEYIVGDRLDSLLENSVLSEAQTRKIARQLCGALYALHSHGVVHRDVKPDNVILRGSEAVLIDLDVSRLYKPESSTDTIVLGTLGYAAPEQFGISQTDGRADIYSLGVTMNIMLTGKHPSLELAGGRMGRIIRRCIETSPKSRYKSVQDLCEVL